MQLSTRTLQIAKLSSARRVLRQLLSTNTPTVNPPSPSLPLATREVRNPLVQQQPMEPHPTSSSLPPLAQEPLSPTREIAARTTFRQATMLPGSLLRQEDQDMSMSAMAIRSQCQTLDHSQRDTREQGACLVRAHQIVQLLRQREIVDVWLARVH